MREINDYLANKEVNPLFIVGESLDVLKKIPDCSVDCVIISPPYFHLRNNETAFDECQTVEEYVRLLLKYTKQVKRILKKEGSFWLNLGDVYINKCLALVPSFVALKMIDAQKWILRNDIIWDKTSALPTSSRNRLSNSYEHLFHFVKKDDYYYYLGFLKSKRKKPILVNQKVISASGVSGINYKRKISASSFLSPQEKENANESLRKHIDMIHNGEIADYRLFLRGDPKLINANRNDELQTNGFFFITYSDPKPRDIWSIVPDKGNIHHSSFPEELCSFPILATCPIKGVVLDFFCGSGTSNVVAYRNHRKSIGIDIKSDFIKIAEERIKNVKNL